MEKENWITEVLNSTNEMTKVVPSELLFSKIQYAIQKQKNVSTQWLWAAAASFTVLATLNGVFWFTNKNKSTTEIVASFISKSNQLY